MGDVRGCACQSVNRVISNNFFVNRYSVFASIKQVEIIEIFEFINGFLMLNKIANYLLKGSCKNKPCAMNE